MKKLAILAAAAVLLSGTAMAAPNSESNGANKNCFGQGRSDYASTNKTVPHGQIISERARAESTDGSPNQNVQLNNGYKANCQTAQ